MKLVKSKCDVSGMHHAIWPDLFRLDSALRGAYGQELRITHARDGKHSRTSRHYLGTAVDMRTWTTSTSGIQVQGSERRKLFKLVQDVLGEDWFVLDEGTHFHLDYRPRYKDD